jgi:ADP-heptose:LPS heptosyltransferase
MSLSNVLFLAEGQLGDLLLLTPAIRGLKESFPEATISVLVVERRDSGGPRGVQGELLVPGKDTILSNNPHISHIYCVRRDYLRHLSGLRRLGAELAVLRFIREKNYDTVISTFPEDRFALWALLSGAKVRVGQKHRGFGWVYNHAPEAGKKERGVLEYYCDLVRLVGATMYGVGTSFYPSEEGNEWVENRLREHDLPRETPFIVVHPGATGDYKVWPPDRFAELIRRLQESTGIPVVLCGGPQDTDAIESVRLNLSHPVIVMNTSAKVERLGALLQRATLCISNDSGPRHLAVAVGTPSLALFRQHHDREWDVYPTSESIATLKGIGPCSVCPPDRCLDTVPSGERYGAVCLRSISVDQAVAEAEQLLRSVKSAEK